MAFFLWGVEEVEDGAVDGLELIEGMAWFGKQKVDEAVAVDGVVYDGVVDEDVGAHGGEAADLSGVVHGHNFIPLAVMKCPAVSSKGVPS